MHPHLERGGVGQDSGDLSEDAEAGMI